MALTIPPSTLPITSPVAPTDKPVTPAATPVTAPVTAAPVEAAKPASSFTQTEAAPTAGAVIAPTASPTAAPVTSNFELGHGPALIPIPIPIPVQPVQPELVQMMEADLRLSPTITIPETEAMIATVHQGVSANQVQQIESAFNANASHFQPAAKAEMQAFINVQLPKLMVGLSNPGSALLSWTAPTQNTDGSPLTDLGGFKLYYGTDPANLTQVVTITNPAQTNYDIGGLTSGKTYYFAATAFDTHGNESVRTGEVFKQIP